jgi:quercetin dioxygenase-like cupin family protein
MEIWALEELAAEPHQPRVLRSDDGAARVIALTLPRGELLQDHQVHEHAWVVLISGELIVRGGDEQRTIAPGALAHFDPAERHEVEAVLDARMVLILSPWPGPGHPSLA